MGSRTPSISSEMPHLNASFAPEMDKYLDLDQSTTNSSSTPADTKPELSSEQSKFGTSAQSQQTFSGPSFQYESFKQQTGIPAGGLANTFALNQATGMQYNGYGQGFVMPTETLNVPLTNMDEFDFAACPMDLDLEAESPTDSFLFSAAPPTATNGSFVDPTVLLGHENTSAGNVGPVQRMYPGMHSRLAAQAKAQQAQKRNRAAQPSQPLLPSQISLSDSSSSQATKDPHLEESISRLLNQMRQSSVASATDDAATPAANLSGLARLKKDEDEMDEDERLLASEEGKKLSSKERRQLRNKVSARAFRSRRKEYIGQLEGEVAVKSQEAHDFKVRNQELVEENTRLTDLTRMLLSSQAFSGFLSELSGTGTTVPANNTKQSQPQPQPKHINKDINPNQVARHLQTHQQQVGRVAVPEAAAHLPVLENSFSAPSWNAGLGANFSVYSLTNLPDGPDLYTENLIGNLGKGQSLGRVPASKPEMPIIENPVPLFDRRDDAPSPPIMNTVSDRGLGETDFPLYAESSCPGSKAPPQLISSALCLHRAEQSGIPLHLVLQADTTESIAAARLENMCSRLDAISARIAAVTSHLA